MVIQAVISKIKVSSQIKKIFKKQKEELLYMRDPERKEKRIQTLQVLIVILNLTAYIFKQREKIKQVIKDGFKTNIKI